MPAVNGEDALEVLDKEYIDLIICDIMMPRMDGFELTQTLRDNNQQLPILMVTARENFADKQQGFLVGIDDYMVKPINVNEMILRVGALLRRAKIVSERKIEWGETVLDYDSLTVFQGHESILLPQKEFYLLYKMISYPNKIFTKQQLMDEIWGMDSESDEHTVVVHVNRLRGEAGMMRSGKNRGLWWYFVSMVFVIILSFVLIMAVLAFLYFRVGSNTWEHGNPFPPILTMMLFSLVIGTTISIMVGRKILAPIADFSKAAKEIASGNFDIYLNESHRVNEISDVAHHFNIMVQELRSIETLRNDFVVNVSHEFKTPIAAIEGYAMLLQEEDLSKEE
ncbi:hypothetical protein KC345_g10882, partial [Hortaea werneckii]